MNEHNIERAAKLHMTASDVLMLEQMEETNHHLKMMMEKEPPSPPEVQKVSIEGIEVITLKGDKGHTPTNEELIALISPLIPAPIKGDDGRTPTAAEITALIRPLIPAPKKGDKGDPGESIKGDPGAPGKDGSPDTPEQIREKLQSLQGDERLDVSAIKGLQELVKKSAPSGGTNFVVSRGAVKAYDLSGSLNGSTRTFSLPAFWRVISVHLSSFPNIMRPTTDYTTDASAMTITFTSEIPLASLEAGQTLLIVYAEP